jgi:hypothetical protein
VLVLIALPKVANLKQDYISSSCDSSVNFLFMNNCVALLRASNTISFSHLLKPPRLVVDLVRFYVVLSALFLGNKIKQRVSF